MVRVIRNSGLGIPGHQHKASPSKSVDIRADLFLIYGQISIPTFFFLQSNILIKGANGVRK